MLDRKFFYNNDHMRNYLTSCVLMYGSEPVLVDRVDEDDRLRVTYLKDAWSVHYTGIGEFKRRTIEIDDPNISFSTVPLGFMNFSFEHERQKHNYLTCARRVPERMWKVGVSNRSLSYSTPRPLSPPPMRYNLLNPGFVEMCQGTYPSVEQAYEKTITSKLHNRGWAMSRDWAMGLVEGQVQLYYLHLDNPIGYITRTFSGVKFHLHQDYFYLQQLIEKGGFRCELSAKSMG